MRRITTALLTLALTPSLAFATALTDLNSWTQIEDPFNANMSAMIDSPTQATLIANGAVPSATDIGYASVNGQDVATSTAGYYFDPSADFVVAIDYDVSNFGSIGGAGIGFGIGEDIDGSDSAGIGLGLLGGAPVLLSTAARVGDIDQPLQSFTSTPTASGRMFVNYNAAAGDVTLGFSPNKGDGMAVETVTLNGLQNLWDDEGLLVSFFLRSQGAGIVPPLTTGTLTAVFSNVEVISGTPIAVPEPATALAMMLAGAVALGRRR